MALKLIKAVHGSHDDEEAVTRKLKQTAKEMEHHQRAASTSAPGPAPALEASELVLFE